MNLHIEAVTTLISSCVLSKCIPSFDDSYSHFSTSLFFPLPPALASESADAFVLIIAPLTLFVHFRLNTFFHSFELWLSSTAIATKRQRKHFIQILFSRSAFSIILYSNRIRCIKARLYFAPRVWKIRLARRICALCAHGCYKHCNWIITENVCMHLRIKESSRDRKTNFVKLNFNYEYFVSTTSRAEYIKSS